jgi:hypothetical protein
MSNETNLPWWAAEAAANERAAREMAQAGKAPAKAEPAAAPARVAEVDKAAVEKELAELAAMRKAGDRSYWNSVNQARELSLLQQLAGGKAAPAPEEKAEDTDEDKPAAAAPAEPEDLDAIEAELKKLTALRKSDPKAYNSDANQARERQLLQAKSEAQEVARMTSTLQGVAEAALAAVPDGVALDSSFTSMFDAMSPEGQYALQAALATSPESLVAPMVTEAQLAGFAAINDHAAELVRSWGSRGAKELGRVHARIDAAMAGLSDVDYQRAGAWVDGLSAAERVAIVRALAGGRR